MTTTVRKVSVSYNGDQKSFFVYPGLECQTFENLLRATFKLSNDMEPIGFLTQVVYVDAPSLTSHALTTNICTI